MAAPAPGSRRPAPAVLLVDGDHAMAPVAHAAAFGPFTERVHQQGVACLAIQRVHHFSALWVELEALAGVGLAAFACTSYTPVVAPFGAGETLFGTNPFAFGWPRPDGQPMIFDMATAAMARGEIMIAEREGHEVPPGTGVDREGKPSVDPAAILAGAQLAFGGYKGSATGLDGRAPGRAVDWRDAKFRNQGGRQRRWRSALGRRIPSCDGSGAYWRFWLGDPCRATFCPDQGDGGGAVAGRPSACQPGAHCGGGDSSVEKALYGNSISYGYRGVARSESVLWMSNSLSALFFSLSCGFICLTKVSLLDLNTTNM